MEICRNHHLDKSGYTFLKSRMMREHLKGAQADASLTHWSVKGGGGTTQSCSYIFVIAANLSESNFSLHIKLNSWSGISNGTDRRTSWCPFDGVKSWWEIKMNCDGCTIPILVPPEVIIKHGQNCPYIMSEPKINADNQFSSGPWNFLTYRVESQIVLIKTHLGNILLGVLYISLNIEVRRTWYYLIHKRIAIMTPIFVRIRGGNMLPFSSQCSSGDN